MYCPNCSQRQISDEMSFCSRCGFSLIAVKQLVATGTGLVQTMPDASQPLPPGQRNTRRGAWISLLSLPLLLLTGVLTGIDDDFAVLVVIPFFCFMIGFLWMLYGVFFADKRAAKRAAKAKALASQPQVIPGVAGQFGADARIPQLYPPRGAPIENLTPQRAKTAEIIHPPSVTENTTKLLDEESDRR